jgi:hypothetical protein
MTASYREPEINFLVNIVTLESKTIVREKIRVKILQFTTIELLFSLCYHKHKYYIGVTFHTKLIASDLSNGINVGAFVIKFLTSLTDCVCVQINYFMPCFNRALFYYSSYQVIHIHST